MMEKPGKAPNRWLIALMCTLLMLNFGTVYAWSYFQKPLMGTYGWTNSQAAWVFSIAVFFLGLAAAWGGARLGRLGPRKLALTGSVLFAAGQFISAIALMKGNLYLLYLGYGVVGGLGLGLGYVTPVATVSKWFPDKKGFATGMVIMGFGFGALFMSKLIAPFFMKVTEGSLPLVFLLNGVLLLTISVFASLFLRNPPEDDSGRPREPETAGMREGLRHVASARFMLIWLAYFLNIVAGTMFIGFQSPMLQDLLSLRDPSLGKIALETAGATLIALSSVSNGMGRLVWGSISDRFGRARTFRVIIGIQALVFVLLLFVRTPVAFGALVCLMLLCYGGGGGTMPSFILVSYGPALMPVMYGAVLTSISAAGIVGPQIVAVIKDNSPANAGTLTFAIGAVMLALGFLMSLRLKDE